MVLARLKGHGIRLRKEKCAFMMESVEYLGFRISREGLSPLTSKVRAIVEAPGPTDIQQLRSYLGMLNYYGRFIPDLSTVLHPMNALLQSNSRWSWTKECEEAFASSKQLLLDSTVLTHYDISLPVTLACDASSYGVGAVLSHRFRDGVERPIAFASRTLSSSERNYSQIEREALSIVFGIQKFHQYVYGRHFILITDHKPLTYILGPQQSIPPLAAARIQRWAWQLSAYKYDIEFRASCKHANADGLSRLPLKVVGAEANPDEARIANLHRLEALPVTVADLKTATSRDPALSRVLLYMRSGWPSDLSEDLSPFKNRFTELSEEDGCLLWGVIPMSLQSQVLNELHDSHPGISKMKALARCHVWWPDMDRNIEALVRSCESCQSIKHAPPVAPLHPWIWPSRPHSRRLCCMVLS